MNIPRKMILLTPGVWFPLAGRKDNSLSGAPQLHTIDFQWFRTLIPHSYPPSFKNWDLYITVCFGSSLSINRGKWECNNPKIARGTFCNGRFAFLRMLIWTRATDCHRKIMVRVGHDMIAVWRRPEMLAKPKVNIPPPPNSCAPHFWHSCCLREPRTT